MAASSPSCGPGECSDYRLTVVLLPFLPCWLAQHDRPGSKFADEDWIRSVFCQLLLALHHCPTPVLGRGVIFHRDIMPEEGEP